MVLLCAIQLMLLTHAVFGNITSSIVCREVACATSELGVQKISAAPLDVGRGGELDQTVLSDWRRGAGLMSEVAHDSRRPVGTVDLDPGPRHPYLNRSNGSAANLGDGAARRAS
jgi:hypothetical protein